MTLVVCIYKKKTVRIVGGFPLFATLTSKALMQRLGKLLVSYSQKENKTPQALFASWIQERISVQTFVSPPSSC